MLDVSHRQCKVSPNSNELSTATTVDIGGEAEDWVRLIFLLERQKLRPSCVDGTPVKKNRTLRSLGTCKNQVSLRTTVRYGMKMEECVVGRGIYIVNSICRCYPLHAADLIFVHFTASGTPQWGHSLSPCPQTPPWHTGSEFNIKYQSLASWESVQNKNEKRQD